MRVSCGLPFVLLTMGGAVKRTTHAGLSLSALVLGAVVGNWIDRWLMIRQARQLLANLDQLEQHKGTTAYKESIDELRQLRQSTNTYLCHSRGRSLLYFKAADTLILIDARLRKHDNPDEAAPKLPSTSELAREFVREQQAERNSPDAPYCMQCGIQMMRAGSMHVCPSCGSTSVE